MSQGTQIDLGVDKLELTIRNRTLVALASDKPGQLNSRNSSCDQRCRWPELAPNEWTSGEIFIQICGGGAIRELEYKSKEISCPDEFGSWENNRKPRFLWRKNLEQTWVCSCRVWSPGRTIIRLYLFSSASNYEKFRVLTNHRQV